MLAWADNNNILDVYKTGRIIIDQAYTHEIDNINTIKAISDNKTEITKAIETAIANLYEERNGSLGSLKNRCEYLCDMLNVRFEEPAMTAEEEKMKNLVPVRKAETMIEQMGERLNSGLPRSHPVYKYGSASMEIVNFIDGKRSILEIAYAVIGECGGPNVDQVAEFIYGLEENGCILFKNK
jgi:hypothetical protein